MEDTGYLRQVLALRKTFQGFVDDNAALDDWSVLTEEFTIDEAAYYKVTKDQKSVLIGLAPEKIRKMNR